MLDTLLNLDTEIFLMLHSHHTQWLDGFMIAFTGRFLWIPLYAAIAFLIFKTFGARLGGMYILAIAAAIVLTDQTCATVIRPLVERLRPSNPDNPLSEMVSVVNGYRGGRYGFPSCHAANSFALVTFVSLLLRRQRLAIFLFGWAIINSYSRLYLGVHYPGDLLIGALIGTFYATVCYLAARCIGAESRRRNLAFMGRPLFYLPFIPAGGAAMGLGITRSDLLITVGLAIVAYIAIYAICV